MITNPFAALVHSDLSPESFVRQSLLQCEALLREMALLALGDWQRLGMAVPELFHSIASLQRPSFGHWNGLMTSLHTARKIVLRSARGRERDQVLQAATLHVLLDLYEQRCPAELVKDLQPLGQLVNVSLSGRLRFERVLTLPISLRNLVAHFAPTDASWWEQAARALEPLVQVHAQREPLLPLVQPIVYPSPWFEQDQEGVWAFNGINSHQDHAIIFASPSGGSPRFSTTRTGEVLLALQQLLGKRDVQEDNFKRLLGELAPSEQQGLLLGDFLVGRPIAQGGFATVHVATQLSTGRKVALKILKDGMPASMRERLRQEATYLSRFNHPHIVGVLGQGEEAWSPPRHVSLEDREWYQEFVRSAPVKCYIALEWIDGQTLEHVYANLQENPISHTTLTEWFAQATSAVAAVHAAGLVHRDIKPSNLMVTAQGTVKLMDFGIAQTSGDLKAITTTTGQVLGTPAYMSPEQLRATDGETEVGPASDLYSLSATFYELYTQQRLFQHDKETAHTVETRKLKGERPDPPRRIVRRLPWEIDTILLGGLEADVADRYRTVQDLERDLWRVLRNESIEYRRPSPVRRLQLWYRRNPVQALLMLAVSLLLLGSTLGATVWAIQSNEQQKIERQAKETAKKATQLAQERLEQSQQSLYDRCLTQIDGDWEAGRMERMTQALADAPPELRHCEWDYYNRLSTSQLTQLSLPEDANFSEDGQHFLRIAFHKSPPEVEAIVWSRTSGNILHRLRVPDTPHRWLQVHAFSPTGKYLALQVNDIRKLTLPVELHVWDLHAKKKKQVFQDHPGGVNVLRFTPDEQYLISGGLNGEIKVWDLISGKQVSTYVGHVGSNPTGTSAVYRMVCAPDGRHIASFTHEPTVRVWEMATGKEIFALRGHRGTVSSLAFSPDQRYLASGSEDQTIKLWDLQQGREAFTLHGHPTKVTQVVFSPDGHRLASQSEEGVRIWDLLKLLEVARIRGVTTPLVQFSTDGQHLISRDGKIWDSTNPPEYLRLAGHAGEPHTLKFLPERRLVTAGTDRTIRVWDTTTGRQLFSFPYTGQQNHVSVSPDGRHLMYCVAESAHSWVQRMRHSGMLVIGVQDLKNGKETVRFRDCEGVPEIVRYSPDGKYIACFTTESHGFGKPLVSRVLVWETATFTRRYLFQAGGGMLNRLAFSPDGKLLVASEPAGYAFRDGKMEPKSGVVRVWDLSAGQQLHELMCSHDQGPLLFSPDGIRLFTHTTSNKERLEPGGVAVWDLKSGNLVYRLPGHTVRTVDPTGQRLLAHDGKTLTLREAGTGKEICELTSDFYSSPAEFSPDGKTMIVKVKEHATICSSVTGEVLQSLIDGSTVQRVFFTPDGKRILGIDHTSTLRVWDTANGKVRLVLRNQEPLTLAKPVADAQRLRLASTQFNHTIQLWDLEAGTSAWRAHRGRATTQVHIGWHQHQAGVCLAAGYWQGAIFHLDRVLKEQKDSALLYRQRGEAHAALDHWQQAEQDFQQALQLGLDNPRTLYYTALVLLHRGQVKEYQQLCAMIQATYGKDPSFAATLGGATVWTYTLASHPSALDWAGQMVEKLNGMIPGQNTRVKGAVLLRMGRLDEALSVLRDSVRQHEEYVRNSQGQDIHNVLRGLGETAAEGDPNFGEFMERLWLPGEPVSTWFFLALAEQRKNNHAEAKRWLEKGVTWLEQAKQVSPVGSTPGRSPLGWQQRLELELLRSQAEAVIPGPKK